MNTSRIKFIGILVFALLIPGLLFAQQGKIRGIVTDAETGDALPGANVIIEGTTLGASADLNGVYIILAVPPGVYTVRADFIGYQAEAISNIRVSSNLTTDRDFALSQSAIQVEALEIVAERPLVNKATTNSIAILASDQIENLPIRGYENVIALTGGVVKVGGTIYVRGGRPEEVAYYIDGVLQNDPWSLGRSGDLITSSIEEVQGQAGGFNAEFGFANSGIVQVITKTGGARYVLHGEAISDEFLAEDEKNIGTFSYGYSLYDLAFSGPVPGNDKLKFYLAGERTFQRDRRTSSGLHPIGVNELTGDVELGGGPLPNNQLARWNWNGNIRLDMQQLQFKLGGNSTRDDWRNYSHNYSVFNSELNSRSIRNTDSYSLKATHTLGSRTFYTATASWYRAEFENGDVRFMDDVEAYGDTTRNVNPETGKSFLRSPGNNPRVEAALARFAPLGTTPTSYTKTNSSNLGLKADFTHQSGTVHELKAGFEVRKNKIRRYQVSTLRLASARNANPDASDESVYTSAYAENIGYNITGTQEVDGGIARPREPVNAAFYAQDKLEFRDLVLNLGVRWDYYKTDEPTFKDPSDIVLTPDGQIDPTQLADGKTYSTISPRIGVSFPVTDQTVFHAQYGKFTQHPDPTSLHVGYPELANRLLAGNMVTLDNPALEPVETTAYEIGFRQQIGANAALDITAYFKEIRGLVQSRLLSVNQTQFATFINGDFGTVKGLTTTFELRRTQHVSALASYTLQFAGGTGSAGNDAFAINWLGNPPVYPTFVAPLDFDQRHTGSISLDFRTMAGEGPMFMNGHPFGRVGVNLLFTFGSGRPYTPGQMRSTIFDTGPAAQNRPQAEINSSYTPFISQLDMKVDKWFTVAGVDFNAYLWVINMLGSNNVRAVYPQSGEPDTDGYLVTPAGQVLVNEHGANFTSYYNARVDTPFNYDIPRQIRLGMRFEVR
jgi:hypothetical protein